jgi:hypothetical protein
MMVLLMKEIFLSRPEMALCGVIRLSSFMKIGIGVQAILRFSVRNVKCCNVGITVGIS